MLFAGCRTSQVKPGGNDSGVPEPAKIERSVSYRCSQCNILVYNGHRCGVSRPCNVCEVETDPSKHRHNATRFCPNCFAEAGVGHRCGETTFCYECGREAGKNHSCRVTKMCKTCRQEVAPDHRCGVTVYCPECRSDVGKNHTHGKTFWCKACVREVDSEHNCPIK